MALADVLRNFLDWPRGLRQGPPKVHAPLLAYANAGFLKLAVCIGVLISAVYVWHDPVKGRGGGTWYGYTLGAFGALLIVWLAWLGVRKRSYSTAAAPMKMWVSAHLNFGMLLFWVATLHCAFRFGFNIHTLAYGLMVLVIASGVWGIVAYSNVPVRITANREGGELKAMLAEIERLNQLALSLADRIDAEMHAVIVRSIRRVKIGGTGWQQLLGRYVDGESDIAGLAKLVALKSTQLQKVGSTKPPPEPVPTRQGTTMFVIGHMFEKGTESSTEILQKLVQAITDRKLLVERVNRDITLRARMSVWLYVHVPLTVALLFALSAHILSVFLLW